MWIADAQYAAFSAQIEFSSAAVPTLKLGSSQVSEPDSDATCKLPAPGTGADGKLEVVRNGAQLQAKVGDQSVSCDVPAERAALALCGSTAGSVAVTALSVRRSN